MVSFTDFILYNYIKEILISTLQKISYSNKFKSCCIPYHDKFGKFFKIWEYQTTLPASWELCMQVKKQQLEPDVEQQTGSKLGKEYLKAVYCHCLFNLYAESIIQNAGPDEAQAGIKIAGGYINDLRYSDDSTLMAESEELKSLLKVKEERQKVGLKLNIQKT